MGNQLSTEENSKIKIQNDAKIKMGFYLLIIAFISWNMPKIWQIVFILWSMTIFWNYAKTSTMQAEDKDRKKVLKRYLISNIQYLISSIIILLIISIRIIPFLKNKIISTGFDTGYYRHYLVFKNALPKNIPHYILNNSWFIQKILDFFRILRAPADIALFIIPALFAILTAYGIYLIGCEIFSPKAGAIGAFLFAVSTVQFLAFDYMLIKNIVGICFYAFVIYFILKISKNFKETPCCCCSAMLRPSADGLCGILAFFLIILSHRTTSFIAIAVLSIFFLIIFFKNQRKAKKYLLWIFPVLFLFSTIAILINLPVIKMLLSEAINGFKNLDPLVIKEGMFISPSEYLLFAIPIIPFAILGFLKKIENRDFDIIFVFSVFCAVWIFFEMIFYKRIIIFLDIALILLSMPAIADSIKSSPTLLPAAFLISILVISTAAISFRTACADVPAASQNELVNIKQLAKLPQGTVLAISSAQSPWIYGWTPHKIIAPGLFGNQWPYEVWDRFWNESSPFWFQAKKELLSSSANNEKPLYIFTGENVELPALPQECLEKINEMSWKWNCR